MSRKRNRITTGLCAFALASLVCAPLAATAQSRADSGALRGLQTAFLSGPIQRFYADGEDAGFAAMDRADLALPNLAAGSNPKIYPKLDRVRAAIANDRALAVFLNAPQYGPALRDALRNMTLYAALPRPGQAGFNDFNAPGGLGGLMARGQGGKGQGQFAERALRARQGVPMDFTTFVSLAPDGRSATLYVLGSLPVTANPSVPIHFTVEARQYAGGSSGSGEGEERPQTVTLLDKQTLAAFGGGAARYFCFAYPLVTPSNGAQADFLIRYWLDPSVAITHGIALARTNSAEADSAASWIAVPMTRVQRFFRDVRYAAYQETKVGDRLEITLRRRPKKAF